LPSSLAPSAIAERLRASTEINLSELESVDSPRGFGQH
jgi:hypothetical protein